MTTIRVLLVDDQPLVRQGWMMRLALEADIAVVGEAGDGQEALRLAAALAPDVVVMDVEMPVMDGIAATGQLRAGGQGSVVMTSIHDDEETRRRALVAGAVAFVGKQEPFTRLLQAIRAAGGQGTRRAAAKGAKG